MKIGVDASCWATIRGPGRHARELVRALLDLDRANEYWFFIDAVTARAGSELPDRVHRITVPSSRAAFRAAAAGRRSLGDLWAMVRAARRRPDLDVFYFPATYTAFPVPRGPKVVLTVHDALAARHPHLAFRSWRGRLLGMTKIRWAVRRADWIVTPSEASRADVAREYGAAPERITVVANAPSPVFHPRDDAGETRRVLAAHGLPADRAFLLYVGGFDPHKNVDTLLRGVAALRESGMPDVGLALVGDLAGDVSFSNQPALRDLVARLGLSAHVTFTGRLSDPDLACVYRAAALVVVPSVHEGFGLPVVEAMACGTPVLVSRAGALPEVAGDAGELFDPASPAALADRARAILSDEARRAAMRARGLRRAGDYSWERSARTLLSVFEQFGDRHRAAAP